MGYMIIWYAFFMGIGYLIGHLTGAIVGGVIASGLLLLGIAKS